MLIATDNHFTDFYPVGAGQLDRRSCRRHSVLDHEHERADAHDIEITRNIYVRGHGSWVQGIFVSDGVGLPFQHVTVTDNVIEGGEYNGITVGGCAGLTISGNKVQPYTDMTSWIRIEKCTDVTI